MVVPNVGGILVALGFFDDDDDDELGVILPPMEIDPWWIAKILISFFTVIFVFGYIYWRIMYG